MVIFFGTAKERVANILYICVTHHLEAVSIHTSQNVVIDYVSAGLGNRILAGLLDALFKAAYIITVIII